MALLLEAEVLPRERWIHDLFVQSQDLVVTDCTGVGEVQNAFLFVLSQCYDYRQQVGKDAVRVRHVDHLVVLGDLGHEAARMQVIGDGHSKPKHQAVWVEFEEILYA